MPGHELGAFAGVLVVVLEQDNIIQNSALRLDQRHFRRTLGRRGAPSSSPISRSIRSLK